MGLSEGFKKFIGATFPSCVVENKSLVYDATILDVMVTLHGFTPHENDEHPAQTLADKIFWSVYESKTVAFCFDDPHTTPVAKHIEWELRDTTTASDDERSDDQADEKEEMAENDLTTALMFGLLPNYAALLMNRKLRIILVNWLKTQLIRRFQLCNGSPVEMMYFFGVENTPSCVFWEYDCGEDVVEVAERPDLIKPLQGEGDISAVYAAHVIRGETDATSILIKSVDTDILLLCALNTLPCQMHVELTHFDRRVRVHIKAVYDSSILKQAIEEQYQISIFEFALLAISKGSDYVTKSITAIPDWAKYFAICIPLIKTRPCVRVVPEKTTVDLSAVHGLLISASASTKRSKPLFLINDGHVARVAWHLIYNMNAPVGRPVPDCLTMGWSLNEKGRVIRAPFKNCRVEIENI